VATLPVLVVLGLRVRPPAQRYYATLRVTEHLVLDLTRVQILLDAVVEVEVNRLDFFLYGRASNSNLIRYNLDARHRPSGGFGWRLVVLARDLSPESHDALHDLG
jgi:hypothetical protein